MKISIDIELDYIDEEYSLDDSIKKKIIEKVSHTLLSGIKDSVKRKISKRVSVLTDKWIMEQLHLFCDRKILLTDKWGDTTESHESVTEMFKSKFDEFFNASVNNKGETLRSCSYGERTTRIDHMLNMKAREYLDKITKDMDYRISRSIDDATKTKIEEKIKKHVLDKINDITDL